MGDDGASIGESFARLLTEVDDGFAALELPTEDPSVRLESTEAELSEMRALFAELASSHVRPVRDLVIDLKAGEASQRWAELCRPSVRSLSAAAKKLDLDELCLALECFDGALSLAVASPERVIDGDIKEQLLDCYDRLSTLLPAAFALELDRSQRESIIIQALLLQVPGVRKISIDKIFGAGLTTLEVLFAAKPEELGAVTGIAEPVCVGICERLQRYRTELKETSPEAARAMERGQLRQLLHDLREQHLAYEKAAAGWSAEALAKKKTMRALREGTFLKIKVMLARLGEVERLDAVERVPFAEKLTQLEKFLEGPSWNYLPPM